MLIVAPGKGCDSAYHYEVAYSYANNVLFKGNPGGKLAMRADDYEFYKKNSGDVDIITLSLGFYTMA